MFPLLALNFLQTGFDLLNFPLAAAGLLLALGRALFALGLLLGLGRGGLRRLGYGLLPGPVRAELGESAAEVRERAVF